MNLIAQLKRAGNRRSPLSKVPKKGRKGGAASGIKTEKQARGNPGKVDEALWARAKRIVKPDWDRYDEPWAVVQKVYKNLGGR